MMLLEELGERCAVAEIHILVGKYNVHRSNNLLNKVNIRESLLI
jgi:hypothetical protein